MAYERMSDKTKRPTEDEILETIGQPAGCWTALKAYLAETYEIEGDFKIGSEKYGWFLSFRKGGRPLCDMFPEKGAFTALVVLGGKETAQAREALDTFGPNVRNCLETSPSFHDGCWLWMRVQDNRDVEDIQRLVLLKRKPGRKGKK